MEILRIAVVQKSLIASMRIEHFSGVLDRAEILFGARRDFLRVAQQPDRIRAIQAIHFLDDIQIGQMLVVVYDVIAAFYPGNPVNWEADQLIKTDAQIEQGQWDDHAVDDGGSEVVLRADSQEPVKNAHSGFEMRLPDGLFKGNALTFDLVA